MPLVNYSSDSSSDERPAKKARKLPPLPAAFRDLYATPVRSSKEDDPTLHGGRQRVRPHVDGNWPTHVYTEWNPATDQRKCIQELIAMHSSNGNDVHDFLSSDLGVPMPLHISLSQSLSLTGEQRDGFAEELESSIDQTGLSSFETTVSSAEWVSNFTRTRWFLVLHIRTKTNDDLSMLLGATNRVVSLFGQEKLYSREPPIQKRHREPKEHSTKSTKVETLMNDHDVLPPKTFESFHISIAWMLSKPSLPDNAVNKDSDAAEALLSKLQIPVAAVKAKIGNNISTFPLKEPLHRKPSKS